MWRAIMLLPMMAPSEWQSYHFPKSGLLSCGHAQTALRGSQEATGIRLHLSDSELSAANSLAWWNMLRTRRHSAWQMPRSATCCSARNLHFKASTSTLPIERSHLQPAEVLQSPWNLGISIVLDLRRSHALVKANVIVNKGTLVASRAFGSETRHRRSPAPYFVQAYLGISTEAAEAGFFGS